MQITSMFLSDDVWMLVHLWLSAGDARRLASVSSKLYHLLSWRRLHLGDGMYHLQLLMVRGQPVWVVPGGGCDER